MSSEEEKVDLGITATSGKTPTLAERSDGEQVEDREIGSMLRLFCLEDTPENIGLARNWLQWFQQADVGLSYGPGVMTIGLVDTDRQWKEPNRLNIFWIDKKVNSPHYKHNPVSVNPDGSVVVQGRTKTPREIVRREAELSITPYYVSITERSPRPKSIAFWPSQAVRRLAGKE